MSTANQNLFGKPTATAAFAPAACSASDCFAPHTSQTWKRLAQHCATDTIVKTQQALLDRGIPMLNENQRHLIEAMIFGVIIGAYHNIAEEAVNGVDVTGALHAGDV